MLNGIDPIIIFNFKKIAGLSDLIGQIPVLSDIVSVIDLPAVPIYLSERLTGIYIDTESKNIDVDTTVDALTNGGQPVTTQRPIQSTVKIEMIANSDSLGVAIFSAMADLIFPKVTSKEYSVTYLHGAVTVFAGLLHSFSINQNSNSTLHTIGLELIKPSAAVPKGPPVVPGFTGVRPNL
jgi:hypothetical protein